MEPDEFIGLVTQAVGGDQELAARATRATLETLAERVGVDEARHLVTQLGDELGGWFWTAGPAKGFDVDEFVRRVAEREEVDVERAERHAAAVFIALGRALGDTEFAHLRARLSRDYAALLPKGPFAGTVSAEDFVAEVAAGTGLEPAGARRLIEAVLETLAERIAPGDAEDLIARLPLALHGALKRGMSYVDAGTAIPVDEFLRRLAARAGVPPDQARSGARVVLAALRRALAEEFPDITAQLPDAYRTLLGV